MTTAGITRTRWAVCYRPNHVISAARAIRKVAADEIRSDIQIRLCCGHIAFVLDRPKFNGGSNDFQLKRARLGS